MCKIIVMANQKGGVAKTSSTRNLAYSLAELGKKVLAVDFDPQTNLTISFGVAPAALQETAASLMMKLVMDEALPEKESCILNIEENIHYLNPPVADVFRGFLAETGMISADVKQALSNMKPKLDNYIFREWVDAAIACQDDKSLKSTLTPIIGKLSDMRIVAAELDYLMYEPFKEFITMAFLLVGNIPLLYFLNKDWYNVLVNTGFGKGILAVCLLVLLISFAAVIRLTKPVEYKR